MVDKEFYVCMYGSKHREEERPCTMKHTALQIPRIMNYPLYIQHDDS